MRSQDLKWEMIPDLIKSLPSNLFSLLLILQRWPEKFYLNDLKLMKSMVEIAEPKSTRQMLRDAAHDCIDRAIKNK